MFLNIFLFCAIGYGTAGVHAGIHARFLSMDPITACNTSPRTSCGVGDPLLRGTLVGNNPKVGLSLIRICAVCRFETHFRLVWSVQVVSWMLVGC